MIGMIENDAKNIDSLRPGFWRKLERQYMRFEGLEEGCAFWTDIVAKVHIRHTHDANRPTA